MYALTDEQVTFFTENGYLHIPNFFSDEEVAIFRQGCRKNAAGDSTCRPEFQKVMFSEKLIGVMHGLLGTHLLYPGLSLTRTHDGPMSVGSRFFHTDTVNDDNNFTAEYAVLNTGMYLQDHTHFSGGLKIRPGSHLRPCITNKTCKEWIKKMMKSIIRFDFKTLWDLLRFQRSVNIPSMPQDLMVWSVRTHHSGYAVRPRFFPNLSLPPILENLIPPFLRLPDNPDRDVILSIYAAPNRYFEGYIKNQIKKAHRKGHYLGNACLESEEMQNLAKKLGVEIRNDGYHYAIDPKSVFEEHAGKVLASGGQQYYG